MIIQPPVNRLRQAFEPRRPGIAAFAAALLLLTGAGPRRTTLAHDATTHLPRLVATIPLPGVNGRIDHIAFDPGRERLYVAALGNNSLEIVDLKTLAWSGRVGGLPEAQGIAYIPGSDEIAVSSGGDGTCSFFSAAPLTRIGQVRIGEDADNIRFDAASGRLIVGYGNGGLALVDPVKRSVVATVKLPGHPESFQVDPSGRRAFVNVPDVNEIVVADLDLHTVLTRWAVPARANFPMAIDPAGAALYVACRAPASLIAYDLRSGTIRGKAPVAGDADDVFFDSGNQRVYVSCGAGEIDLFHIDPAGKLTSEGAVPTVNGARTSLFVPERHQLFVAARRSAAAPARILVFDAS